MIDEVQKALTRARRAGERILEQATAQEAQDEDPNRAARWGELLQTYRQTL